MTDFIIPCDLPILRCYFPVESEGVSDVAIVTSSIEANMQQVCEFAEKQTQLTHWIVKQGYPLRSDKGAVWALIR